MAHHLIDADHKLFSCNNVSDIHPEVLAKNLLACDTPAEVTNETDVIITILPDTADVEKVLPGDKGVLTTIKQSKVIVDMSSISPTETK